MNKIKYIIIYSYILKSIYDKCNKFKFKTNIFLYLIIYDKCGIFKFQSNTFFYIVIYTKIYIINLIYLNQM